MAKSYLFVTETFDVGGLETRLVDEIRVLSLLGHKVHLVCGGNFNDLLFVDGVSVSQGLHLGQSSTFGQLVSTVNTLRNIIVSEKIDYVFAHPFTSLIPAVIAAELENKPVYITLHGPASCGELYGQIFEFLFFSILLPSVDGVISVSREVIAQIQPFIDKSRLFYLPNSICFDSIPCTDNSQRSQTVDWLIVSRLDTEKSKGIFEFVKFLSLCGEGSIAIAGDGLAKNWLASEIEKSQLSVDVQFLGVRKDIFSLMQTANAVAGMGRVAVEAMAVGKMFCLIGYDGVKGILTPKNIDDAAFANFSGRNLDNISTELFFQQCSDCKDDDLTVLRNYVLSNNDNAKNLTNFIDRIDDIGNIDRPSLLGRVFDYCSSITISDSNPYLNSAVFFDKVGRLLNSSLATDQALLASYRFYRQRFDNGYFDYLFSNHVKSLDAMGQIRLNEILDLRRERNEFDQKLADNSSRIRTEFLERENWLTTELAKLQDQRENERQALEGWLQQERAELTKASDEIRAEYLERERGLRAELGRLQEQRENERQSLERLLQQERAELTNASDEIRAEYLERERGLRAELGRLQEQWENERQSLERLLQQERAELTKASDEIRAEYLERERGLRAELKILREKHETERSKLISLKNENVKLLVKLDKSVNYSNLLLRDSLKNIEECAIVVSGMKSDLSSVLNNESRGVNSPLFTWINGVGKLSRYAFGNQPGLLNFENDIGDKLGDSVEKIVALASANDFLYAAYKLILGREPDAIGYKHYESQLYSGVSRENVLVSMRRSKEGMAYGSILPGLDDLIKESFLSGVPLVGKAIEKKRQLRRVNALFEHVAHLDKSISSVKRDIGGYLSTTIGLDKVGEVTDAGSGLWTETECDSDTGHNLIGANDFNRSLLSDDVIVITGVPYDDVGGGQRGAQLARCALKTGRRVKYIYVYKKFDFSLNQYVDSDVKVFGLDHLFIDDISPPELMAKISPNSTLVVEFPHPKILPFLRLAKIRGVKTVFELIDDWETSLGGDWFNIDIYKQFVHESEVVVGTAKLLVNRLVSHSREDALYLPNAANEGIFDKYKTYARPADIPWRESIKALYFGSLYGEWFGWEYVIECAKNHPNVDIILIGDSERKEGLPQNIIFLGGKLIEELPAYLAHTDVAVLPFIPGKISDAVSPIKVFEYLFMGKPVVSTRLPELVGYPNVRITDSVAEFSAAISDLTWVARNCIDNDVFISRNSWFSRLDKIVQKKSPAGAKEFSAIILIHNNKNIIGRCLDSLIFHCDVYLKDIIVVDNASSDGGAEFVEQNFPSVTVIRNPKNGCSSGRNLGVEVATGQYLAFFDSDQWFTSSSCFAEAYAALENNGGLGVIGWAAGWFDKTRDDLAGPITDYCPNRGMNRLAMNRGYRTDIGYLGTGGFYVPSKLFQATDGFDEFYDPTCFEDTDLSFSIKKLGFEVGYRDLVGIRHQPHQTTQAGGGSDSYRSLFLRNSSYFKQKWNNFPMFYVDYPGDEA